MSPEGLLTCANTPFPLTVPLETGAGLYPGLTISADGRVLYTSQTTRSELMMVEGLR